MKHCPECQAELKLQKHKIFSSWICPEGHGTLYPAGELEHIIRAISGLGELDLGLWEDRERYSVIESTLPSPEGTRPMLEIRDKNHMNIIVYGDQDNHSLWLHTGEEEKLLEHIEREQHVDSVAAYLILAGKEAAAIFDDDQPLSESTSHLLVSLKLLGERILRAMPHLTF